MADKPFYRTEYRLQRIGGDDKEFLVVDFQLEDELNAELVDDSGALDGTDPAGPPSMP